MTWFPRSCQAKFAFRTILTPETYEARYFSGDMNMDRWCEMTCMVYTDIMNFPRAAEVIRGNWPLMTSCNFSGFCAPRGIFMRWFWIRHLFSIHTCRNSVIGGIIYSKKNDNFYRKWFFEFWPPKWFVGGRKPSYCILKTVRSVLVIKSRV